MIRIINEDGSITEREPSAAEIKQNEKDQELLKAEEEKIKAKKIARDSALAKLAALGLTEDEIAAL